MCFLFVKYVHSEVMKSQVGKMSMCILFSNCTKKGISQNTSHQFLNQIDGSMKRLVSWALTKRLVSWANIIGSNKGGQFCRLLTYPRNRSGSRAGPRGMSQVTYLRSVLLFSSMYTAFYQISNFQTTQYFIQSCHKVSFSKERWNFQLYQMPLAM